MSLGYRKLSRKSNQRKALLRDLITDLILNGRIETTVSKAKELKRLADKMVTLGKANTLASRRQAAELIRFEKDDEDKVNDIAEGFIKKNFKPNTLNEDTTVEETMKKAVCESSDDDEEIVEVNDEVVEGMMGLPTSKKDK